MINQDRLWMNLLELGDITEKNQPYTRRSFSEKFLKGREWLIYKMHEAGLKTHIDVAGNLIGRKSGLNKDLGILMIGSHSDTVPSGGRFDGIAGILAGLECAQILKDQNIVLNHDLEIVDFLAEEPSEWGISCVGSRGMAGFLNQDLLALTHPQTQETLKDAIFRMGGDPENLDKRSDISAFLELHIEQGEVLETEGLNIGVVTGIVGIVRLSMEFKGQSNHAGTTPMNLRKDALTAASELVLKAESIATSYSVREKGYFVATCGQILNSPNASNVVPGHCKVVLDIRSDVKGWIEQFVAEITNEARLIADQRGLVLGEAVRLTDTAPTYSDPRLINHIEKACYQLDVKSKKMVSGAGHDAAFVSHISASVMVFVPSVLGKSHCPEEWTMKKDLSMGADVLMKALLSLDADI